LPLAKEAAANGLRILMKAGWCHVQEQNDDFATTMQI
jgi:hypothetical protein